MGYPRNTTDRIVKRLKEGRGKGEGEAYCPWIRVAEVPSLGKSSRPLGFKTNRIHELLSDHEMAAFLVLEWDDTVIDIREQYPLLDRNAASIEETIAISDEIGVAHPRPPGSKELEVMTTDFLVTRKTSFGLTYEALAVKPADDLQTPRVVEKLQIEAIWWQRRNITWGIVTKNELPADLFANLTLIRPSWDLGELPLRHDQIEQTTDTLFDLLSRSQHPVNVDCMDVDARIGLNSGTCLRLVKHALARKRWRIPMAQKIDFSHPFRELRQGEPVPVPDLPRRRAA